MSTAKITLFGMYKWMKDSEDDLFLNLSVPALMEKSKLEAAILSKGAEFEVLYGDPYFMKDLISIWSDRWYSTLDRWSKALAIEYNPLENYDRREDWTDAGSRGKTGSKDSSSRSANTNTIINKETQSDSGNNSGTTSTASAHSGSDEHTVSAYDTSTYQPEDKDTSSDKNNETTVDHRNIKNDRSISGSNTAVSSTSATGSETDTEREHNTAIHAGRTHGNIGVTTSQQMLQSELDIARFNLYDEAADLFLREFCIYTY